MAGLGSAVPAVPAAIAVVCGFPLTSSMLVFLDATEPLVQATVFLKWTTHAAVGGTPARVSLPTFKMVRAFIRCCTIGSLPADLAAAQAPRQQHPHIYTYGRRMESHSH